MIVLSVIVCLLLVAAVVYYVVYIRRESKKLKAHSSVYNTNAANAKAYDESKRYSRNSLKSVILEILTSLNCSYTIEEDKTIVFDYQAAKFRIIYYDDQAVVDVFYLYFYTTPFKDMNVVRYLCNELNTQSKITKFFYTFDNSHNEIDVHCSTHFLLSDTMEFMKRVLVRTLNDLFVSRRNFLNSINDIFEKRKDSQSIDDPEVELFKQNREKFLLYEQEIMHQPTHIPPRVGEESIVTLNYLLCKALDLIDVDWVKLTVYGQEERVLTDAKEIAAFNVLNTVIDASDRRQAVFKNEDATLVVCFTNPKLKSTNKVQRVMIDVKADGVTDDTLYTRITCCVIPHTVSKLVTCNSKNNQVVSVSFLLAFDKISIENKLAKLKYMVQDAQDKIEKNCYHELSEEQKVLVDCTNESIAYDLYFGKTCFLNKRYYEALFYLENAFFVLNESFHTLNAVGRNKFFQVCYYIGFSYCELKLYRHAYYYLSAMINEESYVYLKEFVNCISNMNDFRAIYFVRNIIDKINDDLDKSEGSPTEELLHFVNFIKRRQAFVLINIKHYDEAEQMLREMLEDPINKDFAINELAYLQRIRE